MLLAVCSLSIKADDIKQETKINIENFPISFTEMEKSVGAKETIDIFIPTTSYLNLTLFDEVPLTTNDYKFLTVNPRKVGTSRANNELKKHINKIVTFKNGKLVTINLKGLDYQTLRISEDMSDNNFILEYEFADGYVLSTRLILSQYKFDNTYGQVNQELDYLESRYTSFLSDQHYKKEFFKKGFINLDTGKYVTIDKDINSTNIISTIILKVTTKDIEENYNKITVSKTIKKVDNKVLEKDFDQEYKILNNILK